MAVAVSVGAVVFVGIAVSVGAGMSVKVKAWVGVAGSSVGNDAGLSVAGDPQAVRSPMSRMNINNFVFIFLLETI